jgi:hypothetical protein
VYQKVARRYGGRFECICDLVRCTVVFRSLPDIAAGLGKLVHHPQVRILQVKNRFNTPPTINDMINASDHHSLCLPQYVPPDKGLRDLSTGYRDLSILLYVEGVTDGFVCELQLHLDSVLAIKSDDGHTRYIMWRDASAK